METVKIINYIIMLLFFCCYFYQFVYIPISIFKKPKKLPEGKLRSFAVLIAARNEELVIGNLIDSLKAQNYPPELISVYLVADNCTDNTAQIAAAHGATVFERFNKSKIGKGYALNFLLSNITEQHDAYVVFDADNIADRNFIREMNKTLSQGHEIVTGYRCSKNYGDNWISAGYGLWFLREARYLNYPRSIIGASCGVSGTGFVFTDNILKKCGGWNFFLLTEDIEFTAHNIVNGEKIGYCPYAVFYDEQPTGFGQSVRQRMRWVRGYLQVLKKYGLGLLAGCFKWRFSCFDMLMSIAPAAVLSCVSIIINIGAAIASCFNGGSAAAVMLSIGQSVLNICLTVFIIGLITTVTEWKSINCTAGKKILYIFTFPLFMLTYIPIAVAAIFSKPDWKPIKHSRNIAIAELQCTNVK